MTRLDLTTEELTDLQELVDSQLHKAQTAEKLAEKSGDQDWFESAQQDILKFEDLQLTLATRGRCGKGGAA